MDGDSTPEQKVSVAAASVVDGNLTPEPKLSVAAASGEVLVVFLLVT